MDSLNNNKEKNEPFSTQVFHYLYCLFNFNILCLTSPKQFPFFAYSIKTILIPVELLSTSKENGNRGRMQLFYINLLAHLITRMNLTARSQAYEQPFHSASDLYPRKNRFLASTGFSNLNSSMHASRLPQLSRSFSSSKSAKLKLTTI